MTKKTWQSLHKKWGIDLACDNLVVEESSLPFCQYRVFKPAKQDILKSPATTVVTHYMAHELEARYAFYKAMMSLSASVQLTEWGLLPEAWSGGPSLSYKSDGHGFGLDESLKSIFWEELGD